VKLVDDPGFEGEDIRLELTADDGEDIYRQAGDTLRTFLVRRKQAAPLTVRGQFLKGPFRGKSGTEYCALVIRYEGSDVAVGLFQTDEIDGIEEVPPTPSAAS
jgi:hypothetical protein